jgi:Arc/MetJ family transcription regulator
VKGLKRSDAAVDVYGECWRGLYAQGMKRRTNINLDVSLLRAAARALGTSGITQTVHAAMEDVVRRDRLARLAARDFSDLSPEALEDMRRAKAAELRREPAAR